MIPDGPLALVLVFALGAVVGWLRPSLTIRATVIAYDAVDMEHGRVHIVVTSNRLTGRMRRRVYGREDGGKR